jgi:hypothetical protein
MVAAFKLARHPIDRRKRADATAVYAIFLVVKEEEEVVDVMVVLFLGLLTYRLSRERYLGTPIWCSV